MKNVMVMLRLSKEASRFSVERGVCFDSDHKKAKDKQAQEVTDARHKKYARPVDKCGGVLISHDGGGKQSVRKSNCSQKLESSKSSSAVNTGVKEKTTKKEDAISSTAN